MAVLNKRVVRVTTFRESVTALSTTEISKLRVQFKIRKSLTKHPNTCEIIISNLSQKSRTDFETKPLLVQLNAGYDDQLRLLYVGDLRYGSSRQNHADWETKLELGDGDSRHRWARVNKSYAAGTPLKTVLRDAARSMGFELPKNLVSDSKLDLALPVGRVSHGPTRDELTKLLAPFGYHWSIQNGVFRVLKDEETSGSAALPIDKEHGMIGTPEFGSPPKNKKPAHLNVKTLLYPELTPGDLVKLTSTVKTGMFRIDVVSHSGDTHGKGENSWTTELELRPL